MRHGLGPAKRPSLEPRAADVFRAGGIAVRCVRVREKRWVGWFAYERCRPCLLSPGISMPWGGAGSPWPARHPQDVKTSSNEKP